jgi:hypothetical protein
VATDPRQSLVEQVASYALDPLGFVFFAFPWGEAGTELAGAAGPREWQHALLAELGRRLPPTPSSPLSSAGDKR